MKKIIALLLAMVLVMTAMAGCTKKEEPAPEPEKQYEPITIRLAGLKGPTSMGMVKLLDDAENKKTINNYEFQMAAAADEITPLFLKGELDIISVPANLGSVLYNNSKGAVQTVAISTLGVVYVCEKNGEQIKSIADLKGQTIYATGKGTTPEYALRYLLSQNGLDMDKDVTMEWKSEPTEVVAQLSTMDHGVAMIPQPFVTVASTQLKDLRVALDLTKIWDELKNGSQFITATILVRKAFAEENPEGVQKFLEEYAASAKYANDNPKDASVLVEKYGIVKAPIAEKAMPFCNMVCITGKDMKAGVSGYLKTLFDQNPKAVGGQLPGDDYYVIYE
ncbi:MAG: ABC transporter substrate-binding protein [Clostridia bacterium]|nr:ABC transporter substrate-binding protein [Clostridia bacterium]